MHDPLNVRNRTCNGGEEVYGDKHVSTSATAVMLELCLEIPFICLGSDIIWITELMKLSVQNNTNELNESVNSL
jgi:hypothetical protein